MITQNNTVKYFLINNKKYTYVGKGTGDTLSVREAIDSLLNNYLKVLYSNKYKFALEEHKTAYKKAIAALFTSDYKNVSSYETLKLLKEAAVKALDDLDGDIFINTVGSPLIETSQYSIYLKANPAKTTNAKYLEEIAIQTAPVFIPHSLHLDDVYIEFHMNQIDVSNYEDTVCSVTLSCDARKFSLTIKLPIT